MAETTALDSESTDMKTYQGTGLWSDNGTQIMVYVGPRTKAIYWALFDGAHWTSKGAAFIGPKAFLKAKTAPALVVFRGALFMVYQGLEPENQLYFARRSPQEHYWSNLGPVKAENGFLLTTISPSLALASSDDEEIVLMTYKGLDDYLYWATFDGTVWANKGKIPL